MLRSTDMYKSLFILSLSVLSTGAFAQSTPDTSAYTSKQFEKIQLLEQQLANLSSSHHEVQEELASMLESYAALAKVVSLTQESISETKDNVSSALLKADQNTRAVELVSRQLVDFESGQQSMNAELEGGLEQVNEAIASVQEEVSTTEMLFQSKADSIESELTSQGQSTAIGIAMALVLLFVVAFLLYKFTSSSAAKTQRTVADDIEASKIALAEQLIDVDQKLVAAISGASLNEGGAGDHSLALKVADEVTRIDSNLARMDEGVKGHKQLSRSVANVKSNLQASGYEVVEMLGKPYNDGLIVEAEFTIDESLSEGERIITRVKKPEVRFKGEVIQVGKITVSQG